MKQVFNSPPWKKMNTSQEREQKIQIHLTELIKVQKCQREKVDVLIDTVAQKDAKIISSKEKSGTQAEEGTKSDGKLKKENATLHKMVKKM